MRIASQGQAAGWPGWSEDAAMADSGLHYFTHIIDGKTYGGWYRVASLHDLRSTRAGHDGNGLLPGH